MLGSVAKLAPTAAVTTLVVEQVLGSVAKLAPTAAVTTLVVEQVHTAANSATQNPAVRATQQLCFHQLCFHLWHTLGVNPIQKRVPSQSNPQTNLLPQFLPVASRHCPTFFDIPDQ